MSKVAFLAVPLSIVLGVSSPSVDAKYGGGYRSTYRAPPVQRSRPMPAPQAPRQLAPKPSYPKQTPSRTPPKSSTTPKAAPPQTNGQATKRNLPAAVAKQKQLAKNSRIAEHKQAQETSFPATSRGSPSPAATKKGFNTAASAWGDKRELNSHFNKHGKEFGATSPADYANKAHAFYQGRAQFPQKIGAAGKTRVYDQKTNTLGVYNKDGTTASFYKPDPRVHKLGANLDYWNSL